MSANDSAKLNNFHPEKRLPSNKRGRSVYIQKFDYQSEECEKPFALILDFEATCPYENSREHEIIQVPVVLLNVQTREIVAEFESFVQPELSGVVSDFTQKFTGITNEQVWSGLPWTKCLTELEIWINEHGVTSENTTVVTCGDWDLKTMLPRQLEITRSVLTPKLDKLFSCWNNMKLTFARCPKTKPHERRARLKRMDKMLEEIEAELVGHHHNGMDDCKNISTICIWLLDNGCDITRPNKIREYPLWNNPKPYYKRTSKGKIVEIHHPQSQHGYIQTL